MGLPSLLSQGRPTTSPEETIRIVTVKFTEPDDAANPVNWSPKYKMALVLTTSLMTMITNFATYICAPALPEMLLELQSNNQIYGSLVICVFGLGNVCGPLIIAPLSEVYGRCRVYHAANLAFLLFSALTGYSTNIHMAISFRFLAGASAASLALNPPIVGDLYSSGQRGRAMAVMSASPLLGTCIGPVIGGYISADLGWRWTFWVLAILTATVEIVIAAVLRETYKATILRRRARSLQDKSHDLVYRSIYEVDHDRSVLTVLRNASSRPLRLFCRSRALQLNTLQMSLVFGLSYFTITTMTFVFADVYDFDPGSVGLSYLGVAIGMATGTLVCYFVIDKLLAVKTEPKPRVQGEVSKDGVATNCTNAGPALGKPVPERRLLIVAYTGLLVPAGLLIYGWTAAFRVHWIGPIIGTLLQSITLAIVNITGSSYAVDISGVYAASASSVNVVAKYLIATLLPLAGPPLFAVIGYGWANTVMAAISLISLPTLWVLIRNGERLRSNDESLHPA